MGEPFKPVNPDLFPSTSPKWIESMGDGVVGVFAVRGLGAIVMRATVNAADPKGKLVFKGMSIFSDAEIHNGLEEVI